MIRRTHVLLAVAAAVLATGAASCSGAGTPPNVVLISIDTLRPDRLGCYGHTRDTSPTLDRLAAEGVLFTDVTSASPWTLPSHTSMLTGRYPSRHGVTNHDNRLAASIPTLGSELADRGYSTMAVVNSHNLSERYGLDQGFQLFEYVVEYSADDIPNRAPRILRKARRWLEERDRKRPFFLFLHFYDVHTDFTPEEAYRAQFVQPYDGKVDGTTAQLVHFRNKDIALSSPDVQYLFDLYDAEIRQLDEALAEFFAFLEQQGVADNTAIVVTSDHGEEFMEHGSVLHGRTHYQEVIRIPLIVRGPGVARGHRVGAPVHLVDVAPTILSLVGLPAPDGMDGIDLAAHFGGGMVEPVDRLLFSEADHNNAQPDIRRMVRSPGHSLLYDRETEQLSLYDLEADPGEQVDLSESDAELAAFLMERLRAFMAHRTEAEDIGLPSEEIQKKLEELGY